jgi:hypothetical protein
MEVVISAIALVISLFALGVSILSSQLISPREHGIAGFENFYCILKEAVEYSDKNWQKPSAIFDLKRHSEDEEVNRYHKDIEDLIIPKISVYTEKNKDLKPLLWKAINRKELTPEEEKNLSKLVERGWNIYYIYRGGVLNIIAYWLFVDGVGSIKYDWGVIQSLMREPKRLFFQIILIVIGLALFLGLSYHQILL